VNQLRRHDEHADGRRSRLAAVPLPALVLAHQGGWDEALMVATPLALIGLLLWVANRRVNAQLQAAQAAQADTDDTSVVPPEG
jgi:cyanate permease